MGTYDVVNEIWKARKARVLELEYAIFLERKKFDFTADSVALKRLKFQLTEARIAYGKSSVSLGIYFDDLEGEIVRYIKAKGYKPRKTFGGVFFMSVSSTLVVAYSVIWSVRDFFLEQKILDLYSLLIGCAISASLWVWWSKKETF